MEGATVIHSLINSFAQSISIEGPPVAGTGSALVHGSMRSGAALGLLMQEMAPEKARDCSDPWGGEEARQASLRR